MPDLPKLIFNQVITELPGTAVTAPAPPAPPILTPQRASPSRMKFVWLGLAGLVVIALAIWAVFGRQRTGNEAASGEAVRTTNVQRRDFVRSLRLTGTVEAVQSYTIAAPRLAGQQIGQLVVTKLVPSGTKVQKGDLLVEFDRQDQIKNSMDKRAEYLTFVDQIKKKQADQDAARAKDDTDLKQAEDALETAKLDMRKNEVVSRIDAEKNKENLDQAEATLKQLRQTYELKRQAAAADLKGLEIQRDRSHDTMLFADRNAEKMSIHSPLDGLVVLNNIWKGGQMGEVQEGDQVRPGVPFLQVVNPAVMEVRARANQADVPFLRLGQSVEVRLDAYPDMVFKGRLEQIAAIGVTSGMSDKVHTFSVLFSIQGADPKLMPDLSAAVDVELERVTNALVVPRDALISDKGQAYLRVKSGLSVEKRQVKVGAMSDVEAVIESGVEEGTVVLRGNSG
ncbi:MAG TPA: HlyD family efflux transporter periplasmic adaptor subunit [Terriglobia bacterium]|nr:HlyD family efflux transporter periplasmic adaptor subunit [Terriglobia bacterium]